MKLMSSELLGISVNENVKRKNIVSDSTTLIQNVEKGVFPIWAVLH